MMNKISTRDDSGSDYLTMLVEDQAKMQAKADEYKDPNHPDRFRERKLKYWQDLVTAYDRFIEAEEKKIIERKEKNKDLF